MLLCALQLGLWLPRVLAPPPLDPPPQAYVAEELPTTLSWRLLFEPNAAPQSLALQLHGVVLGDPADSLALVSVNGARVHPVRVGNDIAPGVRLEGVTLYNARISRNGAQETLPLIPHHSLKTTPGHETLPGNAPPGPR